MLSTVGAVTKAIRKKSTACQAFAADETVFQKRMSVDIMRHILTFKDPTKQVGVRGGIKAPSCVFYSWKQRNSAPDGAMVMKAYQTNVCVFKKHAAGYIDLGAPNGYQVVKRFHTLYVFWEGIR